MRHSKQSGFTLVELMIVVGVVAILTAIAYPAYSLFMEQANRTDATKTMTYDAQALQRCYSQYFTYANSAATPCSVAIGASPSPNGFYTITVAVPDAQDYTITAVPVTAPQTSDGQCASFTLSSSGVQSAQNSVGADSTKTCWGSN
jgi:type IV pilus assembly protein PilE